MKSKYSHESLEKAEETLYYILDIVSEGIWDWNALTGYVVRSPGWYRMLGYDIDCFEKNVFTWENVIHPEDYERVMEHFEAYTTGKVDEYKVQYRCLKKDGTYLWIEDSGKIVERTESGSLARMIGAHTNIDDAKRAQEKLRKQNELLLSDNLSLESLVVKRTKELEELNSKLAQEVKLAEHNASYDVLTGVYNRRMFEEMLSKEMNRAKRYSHPLSVILLDIDEFKLFNDKHGHKKGDQILSEISAVLQKNLRESDTLARWGGEEFIILLPNITVSQAKEKSETIRKNIEQTSFCGTWRLTCSFGVTSYIDGESSDSIFIRADKALYEAKDLGRNKVQVL